MKTNTLLMLLFVTTITFAQGQFNNYNNMQMQQQRMSNQIIQQNIMRQQQQMHLMMMQNYQRYRMTNEQKLAATEKSIDKMNKKIDAKKLEITNLQNELSATTADNMKQKINGKIEKANAKIDGINERINSKLEVASKLKSDISKQK